MRIFKGLLMLAGGLMMTAACFQPWVRAQVLVPSCFLGHCTLVGTPLTVSLYTVATGFQAYGLVSGASAAVVVSTSFALVIIGFLAFFSDAFAAVNPIIHVGTVLGVIVNTGSNSAAFVGLSGGAVGLMLIGFLMAAGGAYLINPPVQTAKARGEDAHAPVAPNPPTTKTE